MVAGSGHEIEAGLLTVPSIKQRVLRSAAIYGANASGKTNVLNAISYMDYAVATSHKSWTPDAGVPRDRFLLDDQDSSPSYFEMDFTLEGERFTYGFELNDHEILREWLYAYPSGRRVLWFERDGKGPISFGRSLSGRNRVIESLTRPNSLFLSAAAQNNHEQLSRVSGWFRRNFHFVTAGVRFPQGTAEMCSEDEHLRGKLKTFLEFADFGISDFKIQQKDIDSEVKEVMTLIAKNRGPERAPLTVPATMPEVVMAHRGVGGKLYDIESDEESRGTISFFSVLGPVLRALKSGTVLLIDELESSLHPSLAKQLVRIFNDPAINCKGAQFVFTTHDANLLDLEMFRRDQIWFTEKDREGATCLYPLSEFSIRSDYNIARGYLQGRFGAIPFLNDETLAQLGKLNCEENA